jgi:hypothetical protein
MLLVSPFGVAGALYLVFALGNTVEKFYLSLTGIPFQWQAATHSGFQNSAAADYRIRCVRGSSKRVKAKFIRGTGKLR